MTALLLLCALAVGILLGQLLYDKRLLARRLRIFDETRGSVAVRPEVRAILREQVFGEVTPPAAPVQQPAETEPVAPRSVSGPNGHRGKRGRGKRR